MGFNLRGTLKHNQLFIFSLLVATLLVVVLVNAALKDLVDQQVLNNNTANGFVVSSTNGKLTNGSWMSFANLSGVVNINLSLLYNGSHGGITNVTFTFQLDSFANGSYMLNRTIFNNTFNQSSFNFTFDTASVTEGAYNITVVIENTSTDGGHTGYGNATNFSKAIHVVIDRTAPNVTFFTMNVTNNSNLSSSLAGKITLNASLNDTLLTVQAVKFGIQNNNNTGFNITAVLNFTTFSAELDTALVADGVYTFTVYANDSLNNLNSSVSNLTVVLDRTGPNVTAATLVMGNLSGYGIPANSTSLFGYNFSKGLSEGNMTLQVVINDSHLTVQSALFNISNGSGAINFANFTATRNQSNYTTGPSGTGNESQRGNFNLTKLAEGWYNLTVVANDTLNNVNRSIRMAFIIDRTTPSVTVSCTPSAATEGQTVTCTCTVSDDYPGSGKLSGAFEGGGTSESTTATGSSGTSSTCRGVDYAGNVRTATASWTVTAASSGGSGGGGSGGGSSSGVPTQFEKKVWTSINAGETATVEVDNSAIGVTEVAFSVAETTYGAWVQVKKLDSLPSSVKAPETVVYRTLEISQQNVQKALQGQATVKFKVEKSWLSDNSISAGKVALFRYSDGDWAALPTTLGEDDGTYVHYSAATPGFSYFVIGEAETAAAPEAVEEAAPVTREVPAEEAAAEVAEGEAVVKKSNAAVWIVPLVVLLIVGGLLYWYWQRK